MKGKTDFLHFEAATQAPRQMFFFSFFFNLLLAVRPVVPEKETVMGMRHLRSGKIQQESEQHFYCLKDLELIPALVEGDHEKKKNIFWCFIDLCVTVDSAFTPNQKKITFKPCAKFL